MNNRLRWCGAICALLFLQIGYLLWQAGHSAADPLQPPYRLEQDATPRSGQVLLIVLDSWALRTLQDDRLMPRLFARRSQAASGVLWAPRVTGTMQGVLALSTGTLPNVASTFDLFGSSTYTDWTIFDDLVGQRRKVLFHGGPGWSELFGDRAPGSFRKTGNGPLYREDDLAAIAHLEEAWRSPAPPALSVLHLSETDAAAHRFGTQGSDYESVLRFWDTTLDGLLDRVLAPGVTAIITSDHGNDAYGTHGGEGEVYRRVPVLMMGEGISPGRELEIQATDMPATLALLLGTRVPGDAWGIPATAAMNIAPVEEMRILMRAYRHLGMLAGGASDSGRASYDRLLEELTAQAAAVADGDQASARDVVAAIRSHVANSVSALEPTRRFSVIEMLLSVAVFAAALRLMLFALESTGSARSSNRRLTGYLALAMLAVEALAVLRFSYAGEIKALLAGGGSGVYAGLAVASLPLAYAGSLAWIRRADVIGLLRRHPAATIFILYLLVTATLLYSVVATLGLTLAFAYIHGRTWRLRVKLLALAAVAAYFALALHAGWRLTGEDVILRYTVGVCAGLLLWLAFSVLDRRRRLHGASQAPFQLGALMLVMLLFPFSRLQLGAVDASLHYALAALSLGLVAILSSHLKASPLVLLGPAAVLLFWIARADWALFLMLGLHAAVFVTLAMQRLSAQLLAPSAFILAGSALMGMSTAEHAATIAAFMLLLAAWSSWQPGRFGAALAVALAALVIVNLRYSLFDLFGYVDSPISAYLLKHLDLMSAHLGEGPSGLLRGASLVLLKAWLAGALLVAGLYQSESWRPWAGAVMAASGAMLLLNIGQMGMRASLSVGAMTPRFDLYAFSIFVHSSIFVLALLALGLWILAEKRAAAPRAAAPRARRARPVDATRGACAAEGRPRVGN